ncbi:hypothetical protein GCM10027176_11930 [Actinoallomurus bryophytorum]|uniref:Uncharacterized protein n=1 Tax=Actinoallomurus bryophytorum TaxID=1490222 RepID=A0A543CQZ1_9ACTN|nr:hypothetical protein [Actinoallomurus bryophytorum]TQL99504.1 hypothetical protein FB559_5190 [Actinoallomurus bryophytorum]
MKRGSFILVLGFGASLGSAGVAHASVPPLGQVRVPGAYHAGARMHPQKIRLARRLHAALGHELTRMHVTFGVPTIQREAPRRLPHRRGAHVATYALDQLSRSSNVITSSPDGQSYTRVDTSAADLDVWTDRQGRVHQTFSDAR